MTNQQIIDLATAIVCRIGNDLQRRGNSVWDTQNGQLGTGECVKDSVVELWHLIVENALTQELQ